MPEQLSLEEASAENIKLREDQLNAKRVLAEAEDDYDLDSREEFERKVDDSLLLSDQTKKAAETFYQENKDTLHEEANEENVARTEAIVDESARLYAAENEAISNADNSLSASEEQSEESFMNEWRADDEKNDAVDASNAFAKDNLDVLHEAAIRAAEMQEKE